MILFQTLYVKKDPGHVKRAKVKMNGLSQAEGRHGIKLFQESAHSQSGFSTFFKSKCFILNI